MECKKFIGPQVRTSSVDDADSRINWTKVDYFEQYFHDDFYDAVSENANVRSVKETGKSLKCTASEIKRFFGIPLLSGCLNIPQIRMYWASVTRVPRIADAMGRDRYLKLRNNLKIVDDDSVSEEAKKADGQ